MTPTEYRCEVNRRLRARLLVYHELDDISEQDADEMRAEIEDEMEEEMWGKP
jgi:hypothetical protein